MMANVNVRTRLDIKIEQDLKDWIVAYAKKKQTTVTSLVCSHFAELKAEEEKESELVEQI